MVAIIVYLALVVVVMVVGPRLLVPDRDEHFDPYKSPRPPRG